MTQDQTIEQEIQAKGLTAPRVTPADIEANIAAEIYSTGLDCAAEAAGDARGVFNRIKPDVDLTVVNDSLRLLTFCVLVLRNGFTVVGYSACASPENFNAEIGRRIARENAEREIWPLLGFRLRDELTRPALTEGDVAADAAGTCRPDNHTSACTACKRA